MELHIIPIVTLLYVAIMGSHAALTPELYWKEALPNVDMPKSIVTSLPHPEWMDNKATNVDVGKGGVHVSTDGAKGGTVTKNGKTNVNVGHKGGVHVSTQKPNKGGSTVGVGKGGVIVRAGPKKKPVYVGVRPGPNPFNYIYAASEAQLHDDPTKALFFLEKDMKTGHKMTVHFTKSTNGATFVPRDEAESIPFSTDKMSEILREFSVQPGSDEAKAIEKTVKDCETKGIQGEHKYCATSLESMVDYTKSTLGKNVKAISTDASKIDNKGLTYTIGAVKKLTRDDDEKNSVVCHKQNYAYAVFYCHKTKGTSPYVVSLISKDGIKSKAVVICHKNTSGWNPKHLAFQILNVKPGSVPICHFLPEDHVVWVRN
ncbi:hypothetical protein vseg_005685 [Gypsophila vaccaria]